MRNTVGLVLLLLAVPSLSGAQANSQRLSVELTPYGAYRFGGEFHVTGSEASLHVNDSSSYGLLFNVRQHANTQWEIFYSRQQTDASAVGADISNSVVDLVMQTFQGGGTYQGDGDTVRPYVALTVGGTHIRSGSANPQSDTFFSGSMGIGLQVRPRKRLGLRLEARAYGILTSSNTDLFCRTGPEQNVCAIRIDGKVLWQLETFAGIVFRF